MKTKYKSMALLLLIFSIAITFTSCKKDNEDPNPNLIANEQLKLVMEDWYLWYETLPSVNYADYPSPVELLEAFRYKQLDRWSYITTKQQIDAYYDDGEFVGYGIGLAFDTENRLWITYIFNDSPLREFEVDRGWRISAIDGVAPVPSNINDLFGPATAGIAKNFTFINLEGETVTANAAKRVVVMNTVLMDTTYTVNNGKVGYFVLKGFIGPTQNELNQVFSSFAMQGVTDLIVDLRYNGGGLVSVTTFLSGLIAGQVANNEVFGVFAHNDKHPQENVSIYIENQPNSLAINRVVFITTGSSASASELLINGLKPHIPVTLVGSRTYGKPVGMRSFRSEYFEWVFVPICFRILNSLGEGDYYDGIPVDLMQIDGINHPFGDLNEPSLNTAMAFIQGSSMKYGVPADSQMLLYPEAKGLYAEIGAW